jgi:hypothetical protein
MYYEELTSDIYKFAIHSRLKWVFSLKLQKSELSPEVEFPELPSSFEVSNSLKRHTNLKNSCHFGEYFARRL